MRRESWTCVLQCYHCFTLQNSRCGMLSVLQIELMVILYRYILLRKNLALPFSSSQYTRSIYFIINFCMMHIAVLLNNHYVHFYEAKLKRLFFAPPPPVPCMTSTAITFAMDSCPLTHLLQNKNPAEPQLSNIIKAEENQIPQNKKTDNRF